MHIPTFSADGSQRTARLAAPFTLLLTIATFVVARGRKRGPHGAELRDAPVVGSEA